MFLQYVKTTFPHNYSVFALQYIILVLIVFMAQLVGGILGFVYRDRLDDIVSDGLSDSLDRYGVNTSTNTINDALTEAWDFVQENVSTL